MLDESDVRHGIALNYERLIRVLDGILLLILIGITMNGMALPIDLLLSAILIPLENETRALWRHGDILPCITDLWLSF